MYWKNIFLTWILSLLFVASATASDQETFVRKISDYDGDGDCDCMLTCRTPEDLAEVIATYGSPEAFMQALRLAIRHEPTADEDEQMKYLVWRFIFEQRQHLPFTDEDFEYFAVRAGSDLDDEEPSLFFDYLVECKREEALPVLRRMLADESAWNVIEALTWMSDYGDCLPEEDIDRIIALLSDTRETHIPLKYWYDGNWFLAFHAVRALGKVGPRAVRAYDVIIRELIDDSLLAENYDAAKFAAFLEKIRDPGLTPEVFWRLVEETGLKVKREYSFHEELVYNLTRRAQCADEVDREDGDDDEEEEKYSPELLATVARVIAGGTKYNLYTPTDDLPPTPLREAIKHDIGNGRMTPLVLLKLNPDDPRGLFLLLESMLSRYEITNTGQPMQFVHCGLLSESRVFLPIIDLLLRNPEMVDSDLTRRLFLRMPGDPVYEHDEDMEKMKRDTVAGILRAAFECKLTEAECLRYAGIYLDMPAGAFFPPPAYALINHQQEHREALMAMMKARMETEPANSPAYERAEKYLSPPKDDEE